MGIRRDFDPGAHLDQSATLPRGGLTRPHARGCAQCCQGYPLYPLRPSLDQKATRRGELGSSTRAVNRVRCGATMDCSGCSYRCRERIKRKTTRSSPTPRLSPARTRRHGGRRIPGSPRTVWFCLWDGSRKRPSYSTCDRQVASLASESLVPASFLVQVG